MGDSDDEFQQKMKRVKDLWQEAGFENKKRRAVASTDPVAHDNSIEVLGIRLGDRSIRYLMVKDITTISELKGKIHQETGIPVDRQYLSWHGHELKNFTDVWFGTALSDYDIVDMSCMMKIDIELISGNSVSLDIW